MVLVNLDTGEWIWPSLGMSYWFSMWDCEGAIEGMIGDIHFIRAPTEALR
jgi:hypothetical protein